MVFVILEKNPSKFSPRPEPRRCVVYILLKVRRLFEPPSEIRKIFNELKKTAVKKIEIKIQDENRAVSENTFLDGPVFLSQYERNKIELRDMIMNTIYISKLYKFLYLEPPC